MPKVRNFPMLIKNIFHIHGGGRKFYPLFIKQSELISKASSLLVQIIKEDSYDKKKEISAQIKNVEKEGDIVDAQISNTLYKAQLVPFEREDIQSLGSKIETFLDMIHDSAKKLVIYHPKYNDNSWIEIAEFIQEDAKLLQEICKLLPSHKKNRNALNELCKKIKNVEQEVDDLYEYYMSHLFEDEKNGIELTKCKNIVQSLEDTTDRAKEIADCIKMITIKEA